ncbi:MAG TPA: hypothetical protein VGH19_22075 [Verrucomicrobiae bacterium]
MIIRYWCPGCHTLHGEGAVRQPGVPGGPVRCAVSGAVVTLRGVADDPDDVDYGKPRCRICLAEIQTPAAPCPECGTPPV